MPVDLNDSNIDPDDPALATFLGNLQGNILKGHGRDHTANLFVSLTGDVATNRARLGALAARVVVSAAAQRDQTRAFKASGVSAPFGALLLTASGYGKLGLDPGALAAAFPEPPGPFGEQSNFKEGMQAHGDELNDPPPATWEPGFTAAPIDALVLLGHDDEATLDTLTDSVKAELSAFATVLNVEFGRALRAPNGDGLEHFGYVDGRSQPVYFADDLPAEGDIDRWNPSEPLARVLVPDLTTTAPDSFGSYFVFRKLEQNVRGFKQREQDLADALGLAGPDRERAGAMAVGRFEDGTPLALSATDGFVPAKENNFRYDADPDGLRCPFHAHIRKTNPRGDIIRKLAPGQTEETLERPRRITRRGIPFGKRADAPGADVPIDQLPTGGVGLLFMCFQATIAGQFAFMQRSWANRSTFVLPGTGTDPLIGQVPGGQTWQPQFGGGGVPVAFEFGSFVTLKGGEFFFAPSLPFLASLTQ